MTDFGTVVVGAGSSGCALVGRLAELSDDSICLIEAGPDYGPFAGGRWPAELLDSRRLPKTHDWGWSELRGGELRPESGAKVVGGCSAHNQCAALWPEPEEHDAWGVASWDARSVHKARQRIGATIAPRPHAADRLASWQRSFLDAAAAAGHPRLERIAAAEGVAPFDANVREGIR